MSVIAFEGPAGSGKTHHLMEELAAVLRQRPLPAHGKVMALSFMHGSRRRLQERLLAVDGLSGRFDAVTIDSFAWRLTQRWRKLLRHLGHPFPDEEQYDLTCSLAATLLANPNVRGWFAISYPIVLVDEAQDLSRERSALIAAVAQCSEVILAFDEFQCLIPELRPLPINGWLHDMCEPTALIGCHRTNEGELLDAAHALRDGRALPPNGRVFKMFGMQGPNLAATFLANAIAWREGGGDVAILTPSRRGGFADRAVERVVTGPIGKHGNGPYSIEWESNDQQELDALWLRIGINGQCRVDHALEALAPHSELPTIRSVQEWIRRQRSTKGIEGIAAEDVRRQIGRILSLRRRHSRRTNVRFAAMTVQQAKNQEFDHVIVLWPYQVVNDNDQKRRLLYNAVTRAKRSCQVFAQNARLLGAPPFTP